MHRLKFVKPLQVDHKNQKKAAKLKRRKEFGRWGNPQQYWEDALFVGKDSHPGGQVSLYQIRRNGFWVLVFWGGGTPKKGATHEIAFFISIAGLAVIKDGKRGRRNWHGARDEGELKTRNTK